MKSSVNKFYDDNKLENLYRKKIEDELRKLFRDTIEGQFEHDLYNEAFSNLLETDDDKNDTLQQIIKWWMVVVDRGGPIPNDVYDYNFAKMYNLYRKAIDPEMRELVKSIRDRQIIP